jgi:hypothetical protein
MLTEQQTHNIILITAFGILVFSIFLLVKSNGEGFRHRRRADPTSSECAASLKTYYDAKNPGPGIKSKMLENIMNACGSDTMLDFQPDPSVYIRGGNQMTAAQIVNLSNPQWCNSIQNSNVTTWGPYRCNPHNKYINYY